MPAPATFNLPLNGMAPDQYATEQGLEQAVQMFGDEITDDARRSAGFMAVPLISVIGSSALTAQVAAAFEWMAVGWGTKVTFQIPAAAENPTLQVGDVGPYPIMDQNNAPLPAGYWVVGRRVELMLASPGGGSWRVTSGLGLSVAEIATSTALAKVARTGAGRGLYRLRQDLSNPLCQFVGVTLIGDSITWGLTLPDNAPTTPRNGTLADPRNNGTSPSWANLLHQHLGLTYYNDGAAAETAWSGSPSGVAGFEYQRLIDVFPQGEAFTLGYVSTSTNPASGWSVQSGDAYAPAALGARLDGVAMTGTSEMSLTFRFTGRAFSLVFAAIANGARYEVFVNGVRRGPVFSTNSSDLGVPVAYGNVRVHDLGEYVRDAEIRIAAVTGDVDRYILRLEALRITRRLRITNQGIIGTNARAYNERNLTDAIQAGDMYALVQLGTNDRAAPTTETYIRGVQGFEAELGQTVSSLLGRGVEPILCCATAAVADAPPTYFFGMAETRAVIARVSDRFGLDMIDHFTPTRSLIAAGDTSWLADGLHPNAAGHAAMAERIIARLAV